MIDVIRTMITSYFATRIQRTAETGYSNTPVIFMLAENHCLALGFSF